MLYTFILFKLNKLKIYIYYSFAFIEFPDVDSLEAAMSEKQGVELNGNSLYLDYTGSKSNFNKQRGGGQQRGGRGNDRRGGRGGFGGGDRKSNSGLFTSLN